MTFLIPPVARPGDCLHAVDTPALVLDLPGFERNLDRMQKFANAHHMALRPHGKAHKCPAVAHAQIARGAGGICCQKASEAAAFVAAGIGDVYVCNEVASPEKAGWLARLAAKATISTCVDDLRQVHWLGEAARRCGTRLTVLVEVDIGHGRCGVANHPDLLALARQITAWPELTFGGLQAYHGQMQHVRSRTERRRIATEAAKRASDFVHALREAGISCPKVTGGGTGSVEFDAVSGVYTELQAGSYAFMDADYGRDEWQGAALSFEPALFVFARVMSTAAGRHVVVDAGLKSFAMDSGLPVAAEADCGWTYAGISDEHGILKPVNGGQLPELGQTVRLIPGHVDPTFNLYDEIVGIREGRVECVWEISARGASR